MTTIGDLLIKMNADVASLRTDMDRARGVVTGAMADIQRSVGMARNALGGFAAALGTVHLAGLINNVTDVEARLHDLNLTTGISVETLSALQDVGRLSGVGIDALSAATVKLAKNMVGVDEDSKGAAQAIRVLGLDFNTFRQLDAAEQMLAVAKAMDQFSDGTSKAAAAQMLFGKAGAELIPFLKDLAQEQDLVGKVTAENARLADDYQDNLAKLGAQFGQVKREIVNGMLPVLTDLTKRMAEASGTSGVLAEVWARIKNNAGFSDMDVRRKDLEHLNQQISRTSFLLDNMVEAARKNPMEAGYASAVGQLRTELQALVNDSQRANDALKNSLGVAPLADKERADMERNLRLYGRAPPKPDLALGDPEADKKRAEAAAKAAKEYAALIEKIRERGAAEEFEAQVGRKLSDGERQALDLMVQLRDGTLVLTEARRASLGVELQRQLAAERRNAEAQRELKWLEETGAENDKAVDAAMAQAEAYREQAREARTLADTYGMTQEQLQALESSRLRDAAATLEQRAAYRLAADAGVSLAQAELDQAAALRRTAEAREALARQQEQDRTDPLRGARLGVKDYLREIESAGDATRNTIQRGAGMLEDSLVDVFATGKLNVTSFIDYTIREFLRLQVVRPLMQDMFGGGGSLFGLFSGGSGGGGGGGMPTDAGSTPMLDVASAGPGPSMGLAKTTTVVYSPTISIDARSDVAQVSAMVREGVTQGQRQMLDELRAAGKV
jgi:hypothetical protein